MWIFFKQNQNVLMINETEVTFLRFLNIFTKFTIFLCSPVTPKPQTEREIVVLCLLAILVFKRVCALLLQWRSLTFV